MQVEVDQSGKIGQTNVDTVLAFSNGRSYSILIPRKVKQACLHELRRRNFSPQAAYTRFFAVALYLLLRNHIHRIDLSVIDEEYPGKSETIREHLVNYFRRRGVHIEGTRIGFRHIGKRSGAHHLALAVFRGKRQPDMVVELQQILAEI